MTLAALFISGREWMLPAALLIGAAAVILVWGYWRSPASGGTRFVSLLLKALGLAALGFCLLEPLWSFQRARPGANFFAVIADNSQGMQIKDRGASKSRGEVLRDLLNAEQNPWQKKLEDLFQVRRYLFDSRLQGTKDFGELQFDGHASAIGSALRVLADRYQGQPLAGTLLFTDGNATDLLDVSADLSGLPPIYPVVMGKDDPIKDVSVQKVAVSQTAFEDAPVTIEASVAASGYSGTPLVAKLYEIAGGSRSVSLIVTKMITNRVAVTVTNTVAPLAIEKKVAELTQTAPREGEPMAFRFQVRPSKAGISFYRLDVAPRIEVVTNAVAKADAEATLANNTRLVVVDRGRGPYRVLYVAGRPNWEFRYLNRALSEDDQVQLVGLFRVAKREPKFSFLGSRDSAANPLFRGFDTKGEEVERYDQPVLARINTRDEDELRGGFPKTAEELFGYHALIFDDLESEFFTHDQMMLVQKFVSERGGGFLMLAGMESFAKGKYDRTPVGDMLPVYLDRVPEMSKAPGKLKMDLTRDGWLQPWARLRSTEEEERSRLEETAGFEVLSRVRDVKPGASVLANVQDEQGRKSPALIVQRFGRGRTAALTVGDLWKWGMRDEALHKDMDKMWRQLNRWLVADVPNRVELAAQQNASDQNQAVSLQARVRDKKFQPLDNATVKVNVRYFSARSEDAKVSTPPTTSSSAATDNKEVPLAVEPASTEAGLYQTAYVPRDTGGYLAEAVVTDSTGVEVGVAEAGWTADPAADEFRSLKPNRALLEAIAKKTGGEIISADRLMDFVNKLPNKKAPIVESASRPLWHTPWMFLFALACFVAEWGVRRMRGLA